MHRFKSLNGFSKRKYESNIQKSSNDLIAFSRQINKKFSKIDVTKIIDEGEVMDTRQIDPYFNAFVYILLLFFRSFMV